MELVFEKKVSESILSKMPIEARVQRWRNAHIKEK